MVCQNLFVRIEYITLYCNTFFHFPVLSQVRSFLNKVKSDDPVCVNIEQEDDEEGTSSQASESGLENKKIQLDVLLFEENNDTSSDDESEDSEAN